MTLSQIYDFATNRISSLGLKERPVIGRSGVAALLAASIVAFTLYAPLSYGNPWTQDACNKVKLFDTWDFDCNTFHKDLSQYDVPSANAGNAAKTGAPSVPQYVEAGKQKASQDPNVTPQPSAEEQVVHQEEKVEYRDQDGNLLDESQVAELSGKVSFSTKYETRTRVVDAGGNEIGDAPAGAEGFAPPHPDVDREPETAAEQPENDKRDSPATASPDDDVSKEKSVEKADGGKPRPASEPKDATQ